MFLDPFILQLFCSPVPLFTRPKFHVPISPVHVLAIPYIFPQRGAPHILQPFVPIPRVPGANVPGRIGHEKWSCGWYLM